TSAASTSGHANASCPLQRYSSALVRSAVTWCRHNPERCAAASHSSTAFSASGTLAKTRASRAMLEYASTDARGEDSASSGASIARKHLTGESKKARSWYWFARHMQL